MDLGFAADVAPLGGPAASWYQITNHRKHEEHHHHSLAAGLVSAGALALGALGAVGVANAGHPTQGRPHSHPDAKFTMVRSTGAATTGCLPYAKAKVKITKLEGAEQMEIHATGLLPKTEYDLFIIQVPDAPFGLSWYQGDLETDRHGEAEGTFIGRFNEETFSVAPGSRRHRCGTRRRSPTPAPTQPRLRCTSSTWGCGSTHRRTRPRPAAAPR